MKQTNLVLTFSMDGIYMDSHVGLGKAFHDFGVLNETFLDWPKTLMLHWLSEVFQTVHLDNEKSILYGGSHFYSSFSELGYISRRLF